ncbi:unnamed protein product [Medioppia subpectinata]|uniref:Gamma-glutamylcyclotransferase family protein n=1 Tax=Medioppia subpectinata TaxID=1979941 RepID=A0A7R9KZD2_9ACAR|nr:unnamed protein product [Medioppia subpectinata]CAG2112364.1 unnamed protein product [Medioppia subpectinata]
MRQPNHHVLKDPDNGVADLIFTAETVDKWPLVISTKFNVPYLLYKKHYGKKIYGEIYSVDNKMRNNMDKFESHPEFYTRTKVQVQLDDNNDTVIDVWAYFIMDFKPQLLDLETYDDYNSYGSHGLQYVKGCEQDDFRDELLRIVLTIKVTNRKRPIEIN